ncbi:MAG: T9SS type A sorting domain-containing protein [Bacteroidota bacterium]|nr:T9SS type A sorting domain-containing protein [Bacteroidota bacterium]
MVIDSSIPIKHPGTKRTEFELVEISNGTSVKYRISGAFNNGLWKAELDAHGNLIDVFIHDMSSGTTVDPITHGLEFSPSGEYLYFIHETNTLNQLPLGYIDCSNNIVNYLNFQNANDFRYSNIELNKDGKLYLVAANRMATISNPNNPTGINNWQDNAVLFPSGFVYPLNVEYRDNDILLSRTLPDQIDGMDYTEHFFMDAACCLQNSSYDKMSYTAPVNATWTPAPGGNPLNNGGQIATIGEKLIIPAGRTIIIEDMTLQFAPGASLIIEKGTSTANGGNLILRRCTLTVEDYCSSEAMWNGVEVWGDQSIVQNTKQGRITIDNSLIERAHIGVSLFKRTPAIDESFTGGKIIARNSTFKNNSIDVEFRRYSFVNSSFFTKCEFITTAAIPIGRRPHVKMESVQGVIFRGNLFENQAYQSVSDYASIYSRGTGIYSINSRFTVNAHCNVMMPYAQPCPANQKTPNTFRHLTNGINAWSSNGFNTLSVNGNNFINIPYGIYLGNQLYPSVEYNNFEITVDNRNETYGLYIDGSSKYHVTENNFTSYPGKGLGFTRGIVVNNTYGSPYIASKEHDNIIYKNYFQDLYVGGQSQGLNATTHNASCATSQPQGYGLIWKCNEFYQDMERADLAVTSGAIWYHQGNYTNPAGNSFSHSSFFQDNDIHRNVNAACFHYYHHTNAITDPYLSDPALVVRVPTNQNFNIKSCPELQQRRRLNLVNGRNRIDSIKAVIDGIITPPGNNGNGNGNNGNGNNGNGNNGNSNIGNQLQQLLDLKNEAINDQIHYYLHHSNMQEPMDSIISLLSQESDINYKVLLAFAYDAKNDTTNSVSVKNDVEATMGYSNFSKIIEMHKGLLSKNQPFKESIQTDPILKNQVESLAFDPMDEFHSIKGKALYMLAFDTIFSNIVEPIENYAGSNQRTSNGYEGKSEEKLTDANFIDVVSVSPNPAVNNVNISYDINTVKGEALIEIRNVLGQVVFSSTSMSEKGNINVDTSKLTDGIYFVNISVNGVQTIQKKLLLIK